MTKLDMVKTLASQTGITQALAEKVMAGFLDMVKKEVKTTGRVLLPGFGVFNMVFREATDRPSALVNNEMIHIPAHYRLKFKMAKSLKVFLNNGA